MESQATVPQTPLQPIPQQVPQPMGVPLPTPQMPPLREQQRFQEEPEQREYQQPTRQPAPQIVPEELRPQPETILLEWTAPVRPFKKRNRQYYVTIAILVGLVSLILFLAGQFLFIAVILAFGFVNYVLSSIPPESIQNHITTYGIRTGDSLYHWEELGRFWYTERYGQEMVHVETARFPNQITLLLGTTPQEHLTEILSQLLLQEKPTPTAFDKAAMWVEKNIPLEK